MELAHGLKPVAYTLVFVFLSMFLSQCTHSHCVEWGPNPAQHDVRFLWGQEDICTRKACDVGYKDYGDGKCVARAPDKPNPETPAPPGH